MSQLVKKNPPALPTSFCYGLWWWWQCVSLQWNKDIFLYVVITCPSPEVFFHVVAGVWRRLHPVKFWPLPGHLWEVQLQRPRQHLWPGDRQLSGRILLHFFLGSFLLWSPYWNALMGYWQILTCGNTFPRSVPSAFPWISSLCYSCFLTKSNASITPLGQGVSAVRPVTTETL